MYVLGNNKGHVYQYSLSTAYDVGSASYDNINFYAGSSLQSMAFNNNGTQLNPRKQYIHINENAPTKNNPIINPTNNNQILHYHSLHYTKFTNWIIIVIIIP